MQPHITQPGAPVSSISSECDLNIGHSLLTFVSIGFSNTSKHKVHFGGKICNEYTHMNTRKTNKNKTINTCKNTRHMRLHAVQLSEFVLPDYNKVTRWILMHSSTGKGGFYACNILRTLIVSHHYRSWICTLQNRCNRVGVPYTVE